MFDELIPRRAGRYAMDSGEIQPKGICFVAAAIVGSAVVGGVVSSQASQSAASTQAGAATAASNNTLQATQETNALNWDIYQQNLANASPGLQIQQEAQAALASGFGLGTPNTGVNQMNANGGGGGGGTAINPIVASTGGNNGYAPGPGGSIQSRITGGEMMPGNAGNYTPVGAPSGSVPGIPGAGTIENVGASQGQLNASAASNPSGSLLANFTNTDLSAQLAPNMNFVLNQGEQATANYDAAHGITGGQASRDQTSFAENTSQGFYQQAFNNYLTQQQTNISNLSALAGNGSVGVANAAGTSAGNTIASNTMSGVASSNNYLTGGAAATAAGQVGSANAISGAIGNATSGYLTNQLIQNSLNS